MRAFASHEDLWKAAVLRAFEGRFRFAGVSWRETYGAAVVAARRGVHGSGDNTGAASTRERDFGGGGGGPGDSSGAGGRGGQGEVVDDEEGGDDAPRQRKAARVTRGGGDDNGEDAAPPPAVFSDVLYYRYIGAHLPLDPDWLSVDTIPRRAALTPEAFIADFEATNTPVILSGRARLPTRSMTVCL
jgi:hypothetical protein